MEMTGLQIFKYLPAAKKEEHTNCKTCGCPTCMAFALKLAKQNIEIDKCPYIKSELKEQYLHSIKHPQKTIEFCGLKIGGENVLYRHEKTFINPTIFALVVDCEKPDFQEKINRIDRFAIKGVNNILKIDLIILKNQKDNNLPKTEIPTISFEDFNDLEIKQIQNSDFKKTKEELITTRKKAILEKDDDFSNPVAVWMGAKNIQEICAETSYFICKYANMLIFETFSEELFSTILRLRQNIFTDPQKPLQVDSNLYEFNNPDKNSLIFLTTNFALTYFAVANELEGLKTPAHLIVIPADGMSVLTAWSAEKFTANIVSKTIDKLDIRNKIKTRKIIIPGLLSHMIDELKEAVPDFEFIEGTKEASAIREFVKNLKL
ncbi:MAG: hypothetical protein E7Z87_08000 [Cyanobacteria bacterium SIG26]|nr:hypothetical protein [Cyanobacteria bacterium SIG26]